MLRMRRGWALTTGWLLVVALGSRGVEAGTLEFRTGEVPDPDLTLAPDGRELIFSMLGHLFRLPVAGGAAEQITFGPSYDGEPAFSPDGRRVAFVSDRD